MKHIRFFLDFISPYAYLAFVELPRALEGLSCEDCALGWWMVGGLPARLAAKGHGRTASAPERPSGSGG